jgi:hypothetical protein
MNKYPCADCLIKTICSKPCDKIVDYTEGEIFGFIMKEGCCPDCGGKTGNVFYELEYILCTICNSLFYSSKSSIPRTITRHIQRKYKVTSNDPNHFAIEFAEYFTMLIDLINHGLKFVINETGEK